MTSRSRIKEWWRWFLGYDPTYLLFREWYDEVEKRDVTDLGNVTLENLMLRGFIDAVKVANRGLFEQNQRLLDDREQ